MGLTVDQARKTIAMVENAYAPIAEVRLKLAVAQHEQVKRDWLCDARVAAFALAFISATGDDWTTTRGVYSYAASHMDDMFNKTLENWPMYEAGSKKSEFLEALDGAGYGGKPPQRDTYGSRPQYAMLETALRTTGKNWGKLSPLYAELVIGLSLATTTDEIVAVVQTFLDGLR
jgi:hypothetical protein